jgi:hypothetical protein
LRRCALRQIPDQVQDPRDRGDRSARL